MKLCILGAGGNSGRALVRAALARGHDVNAFARDPAKLADLEHARDRKRRWKSDGGSYEDAASVILDKLEKNGPLSRKCVGIALPGGATRFKADAIRS